MYTLERRKTNQIQSGDTFITPATEHPYQVVHIGQFIRNEVRGWERHASCVWLDTGVPFDKYFSDGYTLTLVEKEQS